MVPVLTCVVWCVSMSDKERAQTIVSRTLEQVRAGASDEVVLTALAQFDTTDLARARRLINRSLAPPPPIELDPDGQPFEQWLTDRLDDQKSACALVVFIEEWGVIAAAGAGEPTIPAVAAGIETSVATVNRRLRLFREVFEDEKTPTRVANVLRSAPYDPSLWKDTDEALEHRTGDIPIIAR